LKYLLKTCREHCAIVKPAMVLVGVDQAFISCLEIGQEPDAD
jgi:hypothetical protein